MLLICEAHCHATGLESSFITEKSQRNRCMHCLIQSLDAEQASEKKEQYINNWNLP